MKEAKEKKRSARRIPVYIFPPRMLESREVTTGPGDRSSLSLSLSETGQARKTTGLGLLASQKSDKGSGWLGAY